MSFDVSIDLQSSPIDARCSLHMIARALRVRLGCCNDVSKVRYGDVSEMGEKKAAPTSSAPKSS